MASPPKSAMTSAVPKARPVSQACREKSSSAMMAKSFRTVAAGAGRVSRPMSQLASCHRMMNAKMTSTVSASVVDRGARGASAVTTGSTSAAPCIEPALPGPERHVDGADDAEQQDHQPVHRETVEGVVGEGDGEADAGARLHELARDHA